MFDLIKIFKNMAPSKENNLWKKRVSLVWWNQLTDNEKYMLVFQTDFDAKEFMNLTGIDVFDGIDTDESINVRSMVNCMTQAENEDELKANEMYIYGYVDCLLDVGDITEAFADYLKGKCDMQMKAIIERGAWK